MKKSILFIIILFVFSGTIYSQRFNYNSYKKNNSVLYLAVIDYLKGELSYNKIAEIIKNSSNLYSSYKGKSAIYLVLDELATKRIYEAKKAQKCFFLFINNKNFDITQRYKSLPPPYNYLMNKNMKFLNGRYDSDYIGQDVLKAFFEHGVSINAKDLNRNTLIIYASIVNDKDLFDYAISKGADINTNNKEGKIALYYFIWHNNLSAIKEIDSIEKINVDKLLKIKAESIFTYKNILVQTYLANNIFPDIKNISDLEKYLILFPDRKLNFCKSYQFIKDSVHIQNNEIPKFVYLVNDSTVKNDDNASAIIYKLKLEYINASNSIERLASALNTFPLVKLSYYDPKYYMSSYSSNKIIEELQSLSKVVTQDVINKVSLQIKEKTEEYYRITISSAINAPQFAGLKDGFPEKEKEIDSTCFNKIFKNAYAGYSSHKWSVDIKPNIKRLKKLIANCNSYLSNFNDVEHKKTVSSLLSEAQNNLYWAKDDLSEAIYYENSLDSKIDLIIDQIERSEILPQTNIIDKEYDDGITKYTIETKNFPKDYDIKYYVARDGNEYFIPVSEMLLFTRRDYKSSSLNRTLFLYIFNKKCSLPSIRYMSYYQKEELIKEFNKYGLSKWYRIPTIRERCAGY